MFTPAAAVLIVLPLHTKTNVLPALSGWVWGKPAVQKEENKMRKAGKLFLAGRMRNVNLETIKFKLARHVVKGAIDSTSRSHYLFRANQGD